MSCHEQLIGIRYDSTSSDEDAEKQSSITKQPVYRPTRRLAATIVHLAKCIASLLLPNLRHTSAPSQLKPTSYLDGLRGFAAFLVYWHHYEIWTHGFFGDVYLGSGFGYNKQYFFAAFPGIRNFFTGGHFAVATFFVISGYVLSVRPLSLLHTGEHGRLADSVASALFRRWLRLWLPVAATTFVYMTIWHLIGRDQWVLGAKPQENWASELANWYEELKSFSYIFSVSKTPFFSYNFHLWSIPVEMKGSLVVYMALLALSRSTIKARLWCYALLMVYFMFFVHGWFCALFVAGLTLASLDLLAKHGELPRWIARLEPFRNLIFYHLFALSMLLGGIPARSLDIDELRKNPGWYYVSFLTPSAAKDYKWFFLFFAAVFLVASVPRISWLRRFFESRFCQYLGRISYALYMVHGPVICLLGVRLYAAVGFGDLEQMARTPAWVNKFQLPKTGPLGLEIAFLAPHIVLLPVTLWISEVVTRAFDEPAVKFAQWLYRKTLVESSGPNQGQRARHSA